MHCCCLHIISNYDESHPRLKCNLWAKFELNIIVFLNLENYLYCWLEFIIFMQNTWSVEADSKPTGKMIESDFHERDNSTILEYKHADNQHHMSSKTNPSQSDVNVSPQLGDSNKETSHTYSAQGTDCDDHLVGVTSRNSDLDSQDFESDQLSKEHMSGIEEARRHYRNCEETLTNEQREKEVIRPVNIVYEQAHNCFISFCYTLLNTISTQIFVTCLHPQAELIFDIEEAQRILAEYDAIQVPKFNCT